MNAVLIIYLLLNTCFYAAIGQDAMKNGEYLLGTGALLFSMLSLTLEVGIFYTL